MSTATPQGVNQEGNDEKSVYLIDGSGYIYRAYHAIRGLSNSKGLPTNAVYGFTRMLMKLLEDRKPQWIVMFFDAKGPTFRHAIYPDYKANRPPMPEDLVVQIPYIKKVTRGFNIKPLNCPATKPTTSSVRLPAPPYNRGTRWWWSAPTKT